MNLFFSGIKIFILFFLLSVSFFACTKITTTSIGAGLIPPVDGVTTKDTVLEVLSKNAGFDNSNVGISDNHVLGFVNDPVFGTTNGSINFQVEPPSTPFAFASGADAGSIVLDSVVLCLSYIGAWGDTLSTLKLHVYSIDPEVAFNKDSLYNNTISFERGQELTQFNIAKDIYLPDLSIPDTINQYNEGATNQIRIPLNNLFGQQLLDYDSTKFANDSVFNNYVHGFVVEAEESPATQALGIIKLLDSTTHLSVYYRYSKGGVKDTAIARFAPDISTSASSNTIIRNYQGTQIPGYFSSSNANTSDDLIFMQTNPGTFASIKVPGITGLPNLIIHRAELLMYQVPDATSDNTFPAPNLYLAAYNQDSITRRFGVPLDVTFTTGATDNLTAFGVIPKSQPDNTKYYSFDITRYVQSVVTNQATLYNFVLWAPYNDYIYTSATETFLAPIASPSLNTAGVGRIRLGGGNNSQYKMRLHIVYSLP